jgi:hypothetical protein
MALKTICLMFPVVRIPVKLEPWSDYSLGHVKLVRIDDEAPASPRILSNHAGDPVAWVAIEEVVGMALGIHERVKQGSGMETLKLDPIQVSFS